MFFSLRETINIWKDRLASYRQPLCYLSPSTKVKCEKEIKEKKKKGGLPICQSFVMIYMPNETWNAVPWQIWDFVGHFLIMRVHLSLPRFPLREVIFHVLAPPPESVLSSIDFQHRTFTIWQRRTKLLLHKIKSVKIVGI